MYNLEVGASNPSQPTWGMGIFSLDFMDKHPSLGFVFVGDFLRIGILPWYSSAISICFTTNLGVHIFGSFFPFAWWPSKQIQAFPNFSSARSYVWKNCLVQEAQRRRGKSQPGKVESAWMHTRWAQKTRL